MEENKNKELQEDTQEVVENQEETKSPNARYVLWIRLEATYYTQLIACAKDL